MVGDSLRPRLLSFRESCSRCAQSWLCLCPVASGPFGQSQRCVCSPRSIRSSSLRFVGVDAEVQVCIVKWSELVESRSGSRTTGIRSKQRQPQNRIGARARRKLDFRHADGQTSSSSSRGCDTRMPKP